MRRPAILLSLLAIWIVGLTIVNAANERLQVSEVSETPLTASATVRYLTDNDLNTTWETDNVSAEAEICLENPALIEGLQLYGQYQGNLDIEYRDGDGWHSFIASYFKKEATSGWNLIDLSYDQVMTDRIRLRLTNPGHLAKLGGIKEARILGQPISRVLQRLEPVNVSCGSQTNQEFPSEFLFDHNTYTSWKAEMGTTGEAESVVDLGEDCSVKRIKVFGNSSQNLYKFQYLENGSWSNIPTMSNMSALDHKTGWQTFSLENYPIRTAKIRLVMTGNREMVGPGEIEIWGYRSRISKNRYLYLGSAESPLSKDASVNYHFSIPNAAPKMAILHLTTLGTPTPIDWEWDGEKQDPLNRVYCKDGVTVYQQLIPAQEIGAGDHYLRFCGTEGSILDCRLEWVDEEPFINTPLTDRFALTPASGEEKVVDLGRTYHCDELMVKYLKTTLAGLAVETNGHWVPWLTLPKYQPGEVGGEMVYSGLGNIRRIKLIGGENITEIKVNGSPVNDGAPQVKIVTPVDADCLSSTELDHLQVEGFVDNPEAKIKINNIETPLHGHQFMLPLQKLPISSEGEHEIEVTATDNLNRCSTERISVSIGTTPDFTLNLPDETVYTQESQMVVNGSVTHPNSKVTINSTEVPLTNINFSTSVNLQEGLNIIRVRVSDRDHPKFTATKVRKVVRTSTAPIIQLFYPADGQVVTEATLNVTGKVDSMVPAQVLVNNIQATLNGKEFTVPVNITEGENRISIQAQDQVGRITTSEITVYKLEEATSGIMMITPPEGAFLATKTVPVSGKISPMLKSLSVNGQAVVPVNGDFNLPLNFTEGAHEIVAQAKTTSGSTVGMTRKVVVDTQPPQAFKPTMEFITKNNESLRQVNFATTDSGSGIDHYEIAINDGSWQVGVTSPYLLPETLPQAENVIKVKAVDKAGNSTTGQFVISSDPEVSEDSFAMRTVPGIKKIFLYWDDAKGPVACYRVKRYPAFRSGEYKELAASRWGIINNRFLDTEVDDGTEYSYTIEAINKNGNKVAVSNATVTAGFQLQMVDGRNHKVRFDQCEVELGAGAIEEAMKLLISPFKAKLPVAEYATAVSPIYSFKFVDSGQNLQSVRMMLQGGIREKLQEIKQHFRQPSYLHISYADLKLPDGITPSQLSIYWYNHESEAWERQPDVRNNLQTKTLTLPLKHFSEYQVMASRYVSPSLDQYYNMGVSNYGPYFQNNVEAVSTSGGNLSVVSTDISIPGRNGLDLMVKRIYDSTTAETDKISRQELGKTGAPFDTFGDGWSLNIPWIETNDSGTFLRLPEGHKVKIEFKDNVFEYHEGIHFVLQKLSDKYVLVLKDGLKYEFNLDGRAVKEYDSTGKNCMEFQYRSGNPRQLNRIVDQSSVAPNLVPRAISFTYEKIAGTNFEYITQISTGMSRTRTLNYRYNSDGLLIGVEEPDVVQPDGKSLIRKTAYTYTSKSVRTGHTGDYGDSVKTYTLNFLTGITYPTKETSSYEIGVKLWDKNDKYTSYDDDGHPTITKKQYSFGYKV